MVRSSLHGVQAVTSMVILRCTKGLLSLVVTQVVPPHQAQTLRIDFPQTTPPVPQEQCNHRLYSRISSIHLAQIRRNPDAVLRHSMTIDDIRKV
mmetsp:Transcript_7627/g.15475  ORF Transcript_7627/g.15475 Transcript_7627/m.15475 type:complete len:94 (+) Transcript_7627:1300-1581(+)